MAGKKIWSIYEVGATYKGPLTEIEASSEKSALDHTAAHFGVRRNKLYAVPGALLTGKPTSGRLHATRGLGGCFFFIPQTGQISDHPPRSNYYAYQIPAEKRKFIEGWIEAADVTSSGLQYPSGFIRTLDELERQCRRR